jgi:aldehyde:ferredoxin oxidoreductase
MNKEIITNEKWLETLEQMMIDMPNLKMARTCYDYLRNTGVPPTAAQSKKLFEFWNKKIQDKNKSGEEQVAEEIQITKQTMKRFEFDTTPEAVWIKEFEKKLNTSYIPMLEDLTKYFKLKQQLNPYIKIPNKLQSHF